MYKKKLVPVEPTQWMLTQGEEGYEDKSILEIWRRMLNASPDESDCLAKVVESLRDVVSSGTCYKLEEYDQCVIDAREVLAEMDLIMSKKESPWLDARGAKIRQGDIVQLDSGQKGIVNFHPDRNSLDDQWAISLSEKREVEIRLCDHVAGPRVTIVVEAK